MASSLGADRVPPIRAIQAIGITSAAILGGMNITLSFFSIPACLLAPTPVALKQFAQIYNLGKKVGPGGSLLSLASFTYLAYRNYVTYANSTIVYSPYSNTWKGYLLAAALVISIVPYTFVLMAPSVNKKLLEEAEKIHSADKVKVAREVMGLKDESPTTMTAATAKQLLDQWATLNLGRAALSTAGAVVGLWTALA